ncbi:MAG: radical SAM protein [Deltaproteobacteria bacterium]|jgi:MoaA/NifB/PqqE/SkfB family radical SAM enzyme|nr:radical SAM protein [Deltaproteobacteria bacterium]
MLRFIYLGFWFLRARFFGRKAPLQTVLFVNNKCNLTCLHCNIYQQKSPITKSYAVISEELEYSYSLGSRFVDFEGGEPTLWREGSLDLNSLIQLAKKIGFYSATVTTNAQIPFADCQADSIWVSLDGLGKYHDQIRGEGTFSKLVKNIADSGHPHLSVNMVINRLNYESVEETIEFAAENPHIKSISLNFHTPFEGTEDLFLDWETRGKVIDLIIRLKKQGRPIMNSISGLKLMKGTDFTKHCWVTNFVMADGQRLAECQGKTSEVCDLCGFCMAGEMNSVFRLKLDTIFAGLNLRVSGKKNKKAMAREVLNS